MFFNKLLSPYAMNIKTTKTRISKVHKDKKSKQTMAKTSLNPISNVKDEFKKKRTQSMQIKVQMEFYFDNT